MYIDYWFLVRPPSPFKSKLAADEDSFVVERANSRLLLDRVSELPHMWNRGVSECGDEHIGEGDKWFTAGNCHHHRLDYLLCNFIDRWTALRYIPIFAIDTKCGPMPINSVNLSIILFPSSLSDNSIWIMAVGHSSFNRLVEYFLRSPLLHSSSPNRDFLIDTLCCEYAGNPTEP